MHYKDAFLPTIFSSTLPVSGPTLSSATSLQIIRKSVAWEAAQSHAQQSDRILAKCQDRIGPYLSGMRQNIIFERDIHIGDSSDQRVIESDLVVARAARCEVGNDVVTEAGCEIERVGAPAPSEPVVTLVTCDGVAPGTADN